MSKYVKVPLNLIAEIFSTTSKIKAERLGHENDRAIIYFTDKYSITVSNRTGYFLVARNITNLETNESASIINGEDIGGLIEKYLAILKTKEALREREVEYERALTEIQEKYESAEEETKKFF